MIIKNGVKTNSLTIHFNGFFSKPYTADSEWDVFVITASDSSECKSDLGFSNNGLLIGGGLLGGPSGLDIVGGFGKVGGAFFCKL